MVLRTQRNAGRVALDLHSSPMKAGASGRHLALRPLLLPSLVLAPLALIVACSSDSSAGLDANHDLLADDLGAYVDANKDGHADQIDINGDGVLDGVGVDTNGDGKVDALALDTDCDGIFDSLNTDGSGRVNIQTGRIKVTVPAGCKTTPVVSGGGGGGAGGAPPSNGGSPGAGAPPTTTAGTGNATSGFGTPLYQGSGDTTAQFGEGDVARNGVGYKFIANGWGMNWKSHEISWNGTSFVVKSLNGTQGSDYSPAGYPSMFCGLYSKKQSDDCGLPIALTTAKSVKTGWRWKSNGQAGQYNAAWDMWLGDDSKTLSSYMMVWLRDPPGQQPAGAASLAGATVTGLPGTWNIWTGAVQGVPIINYVKPEGQDLGELEFDVMDVYRDAVKRNTNLKGTQLLAVAVGYEIWNGPVANIETDDFYVDVK